MNMTPDELAEYRRRQRSRNVAVGLLLAAFVVLFFFIALVRIGGGHG